MEGSGFHPEMIGFLIAIAAVNSHVARIKAFNIIDQW
jgi:hypothetical protein